MKKTFEYDTYLYVDVDTSKKMLNWYCYRRGDEWGYNQKLSEFIASGPFVSRNEISRDLLKEIIAFLKLNPKELKWVDFEKTITLSVNGKTISLYDDPHLKSHAEGSIYDIVQEVGLGKEKYFETYKLKEGILAKDFIYDKLVFAHDKEISFYKSEKIKFGTLSTPAKIANHKFEKGSFIWFKENGDIDFSRE